VQSVPGLSHFRYPSTIINEWLLYEVPYAQVAVTHDHDWCALMTEEDVLPLNEDELIRRVRDKYDLVFCSGNSGSVFLSPKATPYDLSTSSKENVLEAALLPLSLPCDSASLPGSPPSVTPSFTPIQPIKDIDTFISALVPALVLDSKEPRPFPSVKKRVRFNPVIKYIDSPFSNLDLEEPKSFSPLGKQAQVNHVLEFSGIPVIIYDISRHPSLITTPYNQSLDIDTISEPATLPPLLSMTLVSPFLPWSITIVPLSPKPDACVTVSDVIMTLYRTLRLAVHPDEFNALPSHEAKYKVNIAYQSRYKYLENIDPRGCEEEKRKGVKRVDFFMGRTMFLGLSPIEEDSNVWMINVSSISHSPTDSQAQFSESSKRRKEVGETGKG